jgi:hypothetical protein
VFAAERATIRDRAALLASAARLGAPAARRPGRDDVGRPLDPKLRVAAPVRPDQLDPAVPQVTAGAAGKCAHLRTS